MSNKLVDIKGLSAELGIGPSAGALYELADMKLKNGVPAPAILATSPGLVGASALDAGTTRNDADAKAVELMEKAAATGDPRAQVNLGWLYEQGKGVVKDYQKAVALFRVAVAQDYPNAFDEFAWFLATCPDGSQRNGKEAVSYATKACEITQWKDANFIGTLAAAYAEIGNFSKAINYAQQSLKMTSLEAAERREMEHCLSLFKHRRPYRDEHKFDEVPIATEQPLSPEETTNRRADEARMRDFEASRETHVAWELEQKKDYRNAAKLYRDLAAHGDPNAQTNLGKLYMRGKGVRRDDNKAKALLKKAAAQGDEEARRILSALSAQIEAKKRR
jgi:TPR repeat protein